MSRLSCGMLRRVVWKKFTRVSEVLTTSIVVMMMAVSTPETSVDFYQTTRRNILEEASSNSMQFECYRVGVHRVFVNQTFFVNLIHCLRVTSIKFWKISGQLRMD